MVARNVFILYLDENLEFLLLDNNVEALFKKILF